MITIIYGRNVFNICPSRDEIIWYLCSGDNSDSHIPVDSFESAFQSLIQNPLSKISLLKSHFRSSMGQEQCDQKKSPNVYKSCPKWFHYKNDRFWHLFNNCLRMWENWTNKLLPKALKSCPKSNKSPNLVTLGWGRVEEEITSTLVT